MKKILLAEDDPFLIDIYTQRIKSAGFEIEVGETGQEVLEKLFSEKEKFDLLLLDIVLPQVSGWEILEKIQSQKGKFKNLENLKIIILSNLGQKNEVEKGLKLGAVKYLIKAHYTPSQVIEEIKKVLSE